MYETTILIAEPDDGRAAALVEIVRILRPQAEPVCVSDGMAALRLLKRRAGQTARVDAVIVSEALGEVAVRSVGAYLASEPSLSTTPVVIFRALDADAVEQADPDADQLGLGAADGDPYVSLVRDLGAAMGLH